MADSIATFSSDNATAFIPASGFGGSNGPWGGDFSTPPAEGSMRVPAMVSCPGTVREGLITEEILSCHDWYQTFAALAGASDKVPTDRPMDGIDDSEFLLGDSEHSGRESIVFFGPDGSAMSVKAHNLKVWLRYAEGFDKPIVKPQMPIVFDLGSDPGEKYNLFNDKLDMGWGLAVALPPLFAYEKSFAQYPNIKPGQEFEGYEK